MLTISGVGAAEKATARAGASGKMLKIRVYENDSKTPNVLVNVPFSLARAALRFAVAAGSLHPRMLGGEIRIEPDGRAETVRLPEKEMEDLIREIESLAPGQIVEIVGDGDRVSIRIE
jgi:hypothetical protein